MGENGKALYDKSPLTLVSTLELDRKRKDILRALGGFGGKIIRLWQRDYLCAHEIKKEKDGSSGNRVSGTTQPSIWEQHLQRANS